MKKGLTNSHWYPESLIKKWGRELVVENLRTKIKIIQKPEQIFSTKSLNLIDEESFSFYEKEVQVDESRFLSLFNWKNYNLIQERKILGVFRGVDTTKMINSNTSMFPALMYLSKYLIRGCSLFISETTIIINATRTPALKSKEKSINDMSDAEKMYKLIVDNHKYNKSGFKDINFINTILNMSLSLGNSRLYMSAILTLDIYAPLMYPTTGAIKVDDSIIYFIRLSPGQYLLIGNPIYVMKYLNINLPVVSYLNGHWMNQDVDTTKFLDIIEGKVLYQHSNIYQVYNPKKVSITKDKKTNTNFIKCLSGKPKKCNVIWKIERFSVEEKELFK